MKSLILYKYSEKRAKSFALNKFSNLHGLFSHKTHTYLGGYVFCSFLPKPLRNEIS